MTGMKVAVDRANAIAEGLERMLRKHHQFGGDSNTAETAYEKAIRIEVAEIAWQLEGLVTILQEIYAHERDRYNSN